MSVATPPLLQSLAAQFAARAGLPRDRQDLPDLRRAALERALRAGVPSIRSERWKYTSLRALERRNFFAATAVGVAPERLVGIDTPRLVFVNGGFDASLSDLSGLASGISLRPLSQAAGNGSPGDANLLARRFERADEVFAAVNVALAHEGAVLVVAAGTACDRVINLVFVGAAAAADASWQLRHLIDLQENARVCVVEHHLAVDSHAHLANALMQIHLKPGAQLTQMRVQDESSSASLIQRTDAVLGHGARYRRLDLELGAALSRNEINVDLQGEGAEFSANGVLLADAKRHLDTRLCVEHSARATRSILNWRGLARERGRVAFHGGILIRAGADGSNAALSNKNLLLSADAEIDTQPVLEIHADEVKAAHGATVGRLDPNVLFYMRSRGIPLESARQLLTAAFCRSVMDLGDPALFELACARLDARFGRFDA